MEQQPRAAREAVAGIDVGSWATKAVVLGADATVLGEAVTRTRVGMAEAATAAFDDALAAACQAVGGDVAVVRIAATGYGRKSVAEADATLTEISAHAAGCHCHFPEKITVVDIGGQDCKVIRVDARGIIQHFQMNRRCASGTGAFLDETTRRMGIDSAELNRLAAQSTSPVTLGAYCTVFTQSEILDRVRAGAAMPDLARGLMVSVVKRVREMDPLEGTIVVSGGVVAHNPVLVEVFRELLGRPVQLPPRPQQMGALGAAHMALRAWQQGQRTLEEA